jgi:uncharacterized membrane protein
MRGIRLQSADAEKAVARPATETSATLGGGKVDEAVSIGAGLRGAAKGPESTDAGDDRSSSAPRCFALVIRPHQTPQEVSTMARDVIVATFETRNQAYEAARDIDKLDNSVIDVQSGVIVEKDMLGNVNYLDSKGLAAPWGLVGGSAGGALLGGLVGTLAGPAGTMTGAQVGAAAAATGGLLGGTVGATIDIADTGIKEDYIAAVSGRLLPGHAALVAEVDEFSTQPVDQAIWKNGGVVFRHPTDYVPA